MALISSLAAFGLRQVMGDGIERVADAVFTLFRDHSQTLPRAIQRAHDRAWKSLDVALAGDGVLDRVRVFFSSGDDKGVREQIAAFLQANAASFPRTQATFKAACLDELKRLRKSGVLNAADLPMAEIAHQANSLLRYTDGQGMIEGAHRAVQQVADGLPADCPNLAQLLRTPTPSGPPLLAGAFCYFFRREVETDDELAHGLFFDGLRQLLASQARSFGEVGRALTTLGDRFDAVFDHLGQMAEAVGQIQATAEATQAGVLDIQGELRRLGGMHLENATEVRSQMEQVRQHLARIGMQQGEVRPGHSFSIRSEDERRAVRALLERFRELTAEDRHKVPALLNGLGKLQVGSGDFSGAKETFAEVVASVHDPAAKAEAAHNAYRAALEERNFEAALESLLLAAQLAPARFAPFSLHRYQPIRILGAGGFGAAVLCHDHNFDEEVVVKTLHVSDMERGLDELFREARILRRLSHPAIIGVRDCAYAEPSAKSRPYLVMDYFPGVTLEEHVENNGPLTVADLLEVATQVAQGMHTAHVQTDVLHRDLKPANLLVRSEADRWQVKIIDFGLALRKQVVETSLASGSAEKTLLNQSVAGTIKYAPPEQLGHSRGVKPGRYSDVYAFGKTCCHALFRTTEPKSRHWEGLPADLMKMIERCTEQELDHRYPDFGPVLEAIESLSRRDQGGQEQSGQDKASQQAQEEQRRREQEEAARQQRELARLQQEGEEKLALLVREAFDRGGGTPSAEDNAAANALIRRHRIDRQRAISIVRAERDRWKKTQPVAPPKPLVVDGAGGGTHTTITEAIQAAAPGAEIRIRPGVYQEAIVLDRAVSLVGDGPREEIVLECKNASCIVLATDEATIRGLTIRSAIDEDDWEDEEDRECSTVDIPMGRLLLEDCDITSACGGCVAIHGDQADPIIRGCTIHDGLGGGVLVNEHGKGTIENCDIFANQGAGVQISQGGDPTVRGCEIHDQAEFCGVLVEEQGKGTIENCDIFDNKLAGVEIKQGGDPTVRICTIHDSREGRGVLVHSQGKGMIENCDIFDNKLAGVEIKQGGDPTVRGCTIHDSREGRGVLVFEQGKGTIENCDIFANKLDGVRIRGEAEPIFRGCKIHDNREGWGGVVSQQGKGTIENCEIFGNRSGGVQIKNGGNPVVRECRIHNNVEGSGIVVAAQGNGTVERCDIFANKLAGVVISEGANPTIHECKIHNSNKDCGVKIHGQGKGTIKHCDIFANKCVGVQISQGGDPTIRECKIHDSQEGGGVAVYEHGKGTIENCDIFANADDGVRITFNGDPTIRRCRIKRNGSTAIGVYASGRGTVVNCDLRGNQRGAWDIGAGCTVTKTDNLVDPG